MPACRSLKIAYQSGPWSLSMPAAVKPDIERGGEPGCADISIGKMKMIPASAAPARVRTKLGNVTGRRSNHAAAAPARENRFELGREWPFCLAPARTTAAWGPRCARKRQTMWRDRGRFRPAGDHMF